MMNGKTPAVPEVGNEYTEGTIKDSAQHGEAIVSDLTLDDTDPNQSEVLLADDRAATLSTELSVFASASESTVDSATASKPPLKLSDLKNALRYKAAWIAIQGVSLPITRDELIPLVKRAILLFKQFQADKSAEKISALYDISSQPDITSTEGLAHTNPGEESACSAIDSTQKKPNLDSTVEPVQKKLKLDSVQPALHLAWSTLALTTAVDSAGPADASMSAVDSGLPGVESMSTIENLADTSVKVSSQTAADTGRLLRIEVSLLPGTGQCQLSTASEYIVSYRNTEDHNHMVMYEDERAKAAIYLSQRADKTAKNIAEEFKKFFKENPISKDPEQYASSPPTVHRGAFEFNSQYTIELIELCVNAIKQIVGIYEKSETVVVELNQPVFDKTQPSTSSEPAIVPIQPVIDQTQPFTSSEPIVDITELAYRLMKQKADLVVKSAVLKIQKTANLCNKALQLLKDSLKRFYIYKDLTDFLELGMVARPPTKMSPDYLRGVNDSKSSVMIALGELKTAMQVNKEACTLFKKVSQLMNASIIPSSPSEVDDL